MVHHQRGIGQRSFRLVDDFAVAVFAKQRQFVEPEDNVFGICKCQCFVLRADGLQDELLVVQGSSGLLVAVDQ